MENRKDLMEQIIEEDLMKEAEAIEKEMAEVDIEVPAGLKEELRKKLHAQIDEYEKNRAYANLSEEDKEALEIGRKVLQDKEAEGKVIYRKKNRRVYIAVAIVALLVLAMGATSMGGAEKIAKMIGIDVGDRKVVQINNDEDNYIVTSNDEEEAYQEMKDMFGVEVVKIVHWPGEVEFLSAEIDRDMQVAVLYYEFDNKIVNYYVDSFYSRGSWGLDIEDKILEQYSIKGEKCNIEIKEYEIKEKNIKEYSAYYEYEGIKYNLIGRMKKEEFDFIIKNLNIF